MRIVLLNFTYIFYSDIGEECDSDESNLSSDCSDNELIET